MHRHQDGSTARNKTQNRMTQWGKIFFEKTLTASSLPPHSQLVVPAQFVDDHGDKFQRYVTLKNVENDKTWTVKLNVPFPQNRPGKRPLVLLYSSGWKAFTIANDLAIGDQLTFVLVEMSLFDVSIRRSGGNSSLSVKKPKIRSQKPIPKRRKTNPETKLRPGPQLGFGIPTNGCEGSAELTRTGTLVAKETAKETGVAAEVAPEAPAPSPSPSGMNSPGFEPMIPQEVSQQECIICQLAAMTELGMMETFGTGFHTVFNE